MPLRGGVLEDFLGGRSFLGTQPQHGVDHFGELGGVSGGDGLENPCLHLFV